MFLAVDIGNTQVKIGLWDGAAWCLLRRLPALPTVDFTAAFADLPRIDQAAITSVVPTLSTGLISVMRATLHIDPYLITPHVKTGLEIILDQPDQVGTDRLLNAAAAYALYGGPVIVVDLGTATKFDVVDAAGAYRGGAIAPGIGVTSTALTERAALLRTVPVEFAPPSTPIGSTTAQALQAGLFWGHVGLVERMIVRLKTKLAEESVQIIATGGYAAQVAPHIPTVDVIAPYLTLEGVRRVWSLNVNPL